METKSSSDCSKPSTAALFCTITDTISEIIRVLFSPFLRNVLKSRGIFDFSERMIIFLELPRLFLSVDLIEVSWYVSATISTRLYPDGIICKNCHVSPSFVSGMFLKSLKSLANPDGSRRVTTKSSLMHIIEDRCRTLLQHPRETQSPKPSVAAYVIDFMACLRRMACVRFYGMREILIHFSRTVKIKLG